jgi:predicted deacylase
MVNPDGVVLGNTRSNAAGLDLNRHWKSETEQHEAQAIKGYLAELRRGFRFKYIFDLHGHSKKVNSFFYSTRDSPDVVRLLPFVASKVCRMISWPDCFFTNSGAKKSTARVQLAARLACPLSYTCETSLFGYQAAPDTTVSF